MPDNEKEYTNFYAKMDFDGMDKKLERLILLRNEMRQLADELGFEIRCGLLELKAVEEQ